MAHEVERAAPGLEGWVAEAAHAGFQEDALLQACMLVRASPGCSWGVRLLTKPVC